MPLLAVCYVKGAGGATTTALGLAAVAPEAVRPVVVECDPCGGDLIGRHRLAAGPGLVELATAARSGLPGGELLDAASQPVRLGDRAVAVVAAPPGGAQVRAALGELTRAEGPLLSASRLVVADCGRVGPGWPVWPVLGCAQVVLVLARARPDEMAQVCEHLGELVELGSGRLVAVLLRTGVYPAGEVAQVVSGRLVRQFAAEPSVVRVFGPLPADRRAAGVLAGDLLAGRRWRRLPLPVALRGLLGQLGPYLTAVPVPHAPAVRGLS